MRASQSASEGYSHPSDVGPTALHHRDKVELNTTPAAAPQATGQGPFSRTTAAPSPPEEEGTWGERDVGGPVNQELALHDFEELQRELSRISIARSYAATSQNNGKSRDGLLKRVFSREGANAQSQDEEKGFDTQSEHEGLPSSDERAFPLEVFLRTGHLGKHTPSGDAAKKLGVIFRNLTVKGVAQKSSFVKTLPQAILGSFGPDLCRFVCKLFPRLKVGLRDEVLRTILHDFTGVVKPGEMLLVLGRPGSGCSTLLKVLANQREEYASVEGSVSYSGISADELAKHYRGEVVYNPEDDQHLPSLTVGQTLRFALLNKTRRNLREEVNLIVDTFLRMFAIKHTEKTFVGNAFIRGISGGERKRVSIAETLATKSTIVCWDNSTRGLDASTALDFARSLRIMTDVSKRTTITTLYQAGEGIYELMDKVLVIEGGRMLYFGPAKEARGYFEHLGFYAPSRQTTPDFLTSLCDPVARKVRPGWEERVPRTAEELERAFRESKEYQRVLREVEEFEAQLEKSGLQEKARFEDAVREQKSKRVAASSNYTIPFWQQVWVCAKREIWLLWGDKTELYSKYFTIISNGLIVGSLFYDTPSSTAGTFLRSGAVMFSVVFLGWLQLAELMKAVSGRDILARHKQYAFYRPSAVALARVLTDFPALFGQVAVFSVIVYFITGLDLTVRKFFTQLLLTYTTTICLTALYRMMAAFSESISDAVRFSGTMLDILFVFTGYVVAKPVLLERKWFGWISHINPLSYAFEAALANEFHGREMECAPVHLIPQGPGAQPGHQGCALPGSHSGSMTISGDDYLANQFDYHWTHMWRNYGIIVAFTVFFLLVTILAVEKISFRQLGGGALVFKKSKRSLKQLQDNVVDEEKVNSFTTAHSIDGSPVQKDAAGSARVFTWENVCYTVPTSDGPKKLLNDVSGYVKPGMMVALMGASGAGKTTLLNTLSQRQTVGVVTGEMLVDGHLLPADFQRSTGFVEQMDLHEETATVREAIEFSALLRQGRDVPREMKLAYVNKVLELLELTDIQDALISSLGVEQKKRLTIGVELAARPSLLLFLDEPTSGLDAQSAFSIVRFLRKLCAAGQVIICTIHQPSSDLIQQFDLILALNPGGKTIYFGPVGEDGAAVVGYFAQRGVHCEPGRNVAEFLLETAIKGGRKPDGSRINWAEEWRVSKENQILIEEIQRLKTERAQVPPSDNPSASNHEFAAPIAQQIILLTKRMFLRQWRDPSYLYGRLFHSVIIGIFNGFTFFNLGSTAADMQNRMFSCFLIIMLPATVLNAVLPKFWGNRELWEKREFPARMYGWVAFCTAEVLSEIPGSIIEGVIYWLLWYLPTGMPRSPGGAGYVFVMTLLFFLFQASWGQWICAWAPSFTVISNLLPCFLVVFALFNGVVVPYSQIRSFWKYWIYWLNPSSYWISGVLSATLPSQPVHCALHEAAYFNPPINQTCLSYARDFVDQVGRGYLINPAATTECGYCPYANGSEYLASLGIDSGTKWRNLGLFAVFCVTNWTLVYFFVWTVRVRKWTFGYGTLSKSLRRGMRGVKGSLKVGKA